MLPDEQNRFLILLASDVACRRISQVKISSDTGVHQSQVSRILSGQAKRSSKNVQSLCSYAKHRLSSVGAEVADGMEKDIINEIFGRSKSEDDAFTDVLNSLLRWRRSWDQGGR